MGRASGRKRERRAGVTGFAGNPWSKPTGVDDGDPTAVRAGCQDRLAKLHALRHRIHHDDRQLLAAAQALHDHHNRAAADLATEIGRVGAGHDPLLENAHAHHLAGRQVAEEVAHTLHRRVSAFDPEV